MGIIKVNGIILRENNLGDADKMVTILTPNYGKIGCAAKGARRPRSALMAGTQFLCFGEFLIFKGNNSYRLNSCEPKEFFYNIRTDLNKLEYVSNITRIVNDVTDENQNTYRILQLYLNTLYIISETEKSLELIYSVFKIRLMCILGFMPIINKCSNCGESENLEGFSIKNNGFKCKECANLDSSIMRVSQSTKDAIKYIVMSPPKKLYSFNLGDENIRELSLLSKLYLNDKLEKDYI
ncbi:MAG: DNA repair protein RecO [Clostridia bacterium]|nr:DNA repair protein RecO [Clostridia bacterium]